MRKVLVFVLLACVCLGVSAKFRWGPVVGVNFSDYHWKQDLVQSDMGVGYSAGVMGELMIPGIGFGIDMGLRYCNRGGKVCFNQQPIWALDGIGETDLRCHTLQIPIDLRFKWTRLDGFEQYLAPIVFAGPLFNFNLATSKCDAIEKAAGSVGIQCGLGVEIYRHFQLTGGYLWGLTYDLRTLKLDNFSTRTQGWFIDLSYLF